MRTAGICSLIWLIALSVAAAQERPKAFVGARLIPIEGDEIERGTLVIENGKIVAVGPADDVEIPDDAEKIDVAGKVIMPGLICTHSHIGGSGSLGGADGSGPIQPGVRIYDSLNVHDSGFKRPAPATSSAARRSTSNCGSTPSRERSTTSSSPTTAAPRSAG